MQILKFFAGVALAALFHFVGMSLWPSFGQVIDIFLVVVALHGLRGNSLSALFVGLLVGLLHDSLTSGPFGLFGFADTIVGYVTARLAQRLVIQRASGVLAVVSFASVLQQAIVTGLAFLMLPAPELPNPLWAAVRAGACGLLGMAVHIATSHWRRSSEARRRGRMSRLRLG
ncbi:MAG TPA: rod shape-determining protein MreD [Thermoanaerobaculia bacterium]|nr:rod shape-determining protein MreD [Thermoanaerobaculia bacterium]